MARPTQAQAQAHAHALLLQEETVPFGLPGGLEEAGARETGAGAGERRGTGTVVLARPQRPDQEAVRRQRQCDLWAYVWTASSVLADVAAHLVAHVAPPTPDDSQGRGEGPEADEVSVVELGAGCGLASLAAATAGATVVATDLVPDALDLLARNAERNGVGPAPRARGRGSVATARLDWNNDGDVAALVAALAERLAPRRLVVGADILFSSWTVKPILATVARLLPPRALDTPDGACLLVDPGRTNRDAFEDGAAAVGLVVLRRVDLANVRTPIALMRVCTLFLVARAPSPPDAGTPSPPWCLAAFDSACDRLRRTRCLADEDVAAQGLAHGYTLPVVMA